MKRVKVETREDIVKEMRDDWLQINTYLRECNMCQIFGILENFNREHASLLGGIYLNNDELNNALHHYGKSNQMLTALMVAYYNETKQAVERVV